MATRSVNGLYLAAHGGTNGESHNHNDVGDFIVYADGYPVIIDVRIGHLCTAPHLLGAALQPLVPIPHGLSQPCPSSMADSAAGRSCSFLFAASGVQYLAGKQSTRLSMDLNKPKHGPPPPAYKSWQRSITLDKKGTIRITDQYSLSAPASSITQTFMTVAETDLTKPGVLALHPSLRQKNQSPIRCRHLDRFQRKDGADQPRRSGTQTKLGQPRHLPYPANRKITRRQRIYRLHHPKINSGYYLPKNLSISPHNHTGSSNMIKCLESSLITMLTLPALLYCSFRFVCNAFPCSPVSLVRRPVGCRQYTRPDPHPSAAVNPR